MITGRVAGAGACVGTGMVQNSAVLLGIVLCRGDTVLDLHRNVLCDAVLCCAVLCSVEQSRVE